MKTKEFIKKVKDLGFEVVDFLEILDVKMDGTSYVSVSKDDQNIFVISGQIDELNPNCRLALLKLLIEYVETPIEEREEPKKYYLKLPQPYQSKSQYLNKRNKSYVFSNDIEFGTWQTQFTQEEIDNLPNQDFIKSLIKEEVR